jgi:D-alanine-D-alanine ligase
MRGTSLARAHMQRATAWEVQDADTILLHHSIERLLPRLRLAVIFGGDKSVSESVVYQGQNSRSWKSYQAVAVDIADALHRIGFRHVELFPEDMRLGDRLRRAGIHMAWLNSGGVQGYNSAAHGSATLEMLGIPYVGHNPLAATTLDNKHVFKREAMCAGLPTAPFCVWHPARGPFLPELNSCFKLQFGDYTGPFIVKPVSGRASLHVHVVPDRAALSEAIDDVYRKTENIVLIEKYLNGREFCIAVCGRTIAQAGNISRMNEPFAFGALERRFNADELIFTSMDIKPITESRVRHLDRHREPDLWRKIHGLAREIFLEFYLGSLIRIDIRADERGNLHILEANPKPDLKRPADGVTSLISAGLAQTGLSYDDLILSLLADRLYPMISNGHCCPRHIGELLDLERLDNTSSHRNVEPLDHMVVALQAAGRAMRAHKL